MKYRLVDEVKLLKFQIQHITSLARAHAHFQRPDNENISSAVTMCAVYFCFNLSLFHLSFDVVVVVAVAVTVF